MRIPIANALVFSGWSEKSVVWAGMGAERGGWEATVVESFVRGGGAVGDLCGRRHGEGERSVPRAAGG